MEICDKVERFICEEKLLGRGETVIVAVSGGPDSVALLHILYSLSERWQWKLIVAHVNHMFRGEESDREADYVAQLAARFHLLCESTRINLPDLLREEGGNAQTSARAKRYDFLQQAAKTYDAGKIALGHHADDQAETVMMRLLRGTGPSGLSGIPVRRTEKKVELVRPLMRIYKSELEQYCRFHQLKAMQDSSNQTRKYFRNRVRHDVLPFLKFYNPQLSQSLNHLAELMRTENDFMDGEARRFILDHVECGEKGCFFSRKSFVGMHVALQRRCIKLILNYVFSGAEPTEFSMIETIRQAIVQDRKSTMRLDIQNAVDLRLEYDRVSIGKFPAFAENYLYIIDNFPKELLIPEIGQKLTWEICDKGNLGENLPSLKYEAWFDLERLPLPLAVRNRRAGDRMEISGLKGSKKVKDMFIDDKVAPSERNRLPLIVDAMGNIVWIPGVRRSKHALVTDRTSRVLRMKLHFK